MREMAYSGHWIDCLDSGEAALAAHDAVALDADDAAAALDIGSAVLDAGGATVVQEAEGTVATPGTGDDAAALEVPLWLWMLKMTLRLWIRVEPLAKGQRPVLDWCQELCCQNLQLKCRGLTTKTG